MEDAESTDQSLLPENGWFVYLLECQRTHRTYIGSTNNLQRRLRQHNGDLKGGAKYTTNTNAGQPGQWALRVLTHFPSTGTSPKTGKPTGDKEAHTHALKYEYRAKRRKNPRGRWVPVGGIAPRRVRMHQLLQDDSIRTTPSALVLDAFECPRGATVFDPHVCDGEGFYAHLRVSTAP